MSWSTESELAFIETIGMHRDETRRGGIVEPVERRRALLVGYLLSCKRRVRWGGIDKDTVVRAAEEKLRQLS